MKGWHHNSETALFKTIGEDKHLLEQALFTNILFNYWNYEMV